MRNPLTLLLLSIVVGFAILNYGGVTAREWDFTLVALCLLSFSVWLPGRAPAFAPPPSRALSVLIAIILAYVGFQLLPMPVAWLRLISPARYEIVQALNSLNAGGRWAPLSIAPQLTLAQLLRLLAYLNVFLLVRELTFRFADRLWLNVIPLLVLGLFESSIGLVQHFAGGGYAIGTYVDHGHTAGLLEMVLPLTLVLIPFAFRRGSRELKQTALTCMLILCAGVILVALLYTGSRMSLAAAAVAMWILSVTELVSRKPRSGMVWIAAASLVLLMLSAPLSLIGRYQESLTSEVRFHIWRDTLTLAANYPVFGCGLGAFVSGIQRYLSVLPGGLVDYAHNDYLQLLAELGIAGFLPLLALAAVFMRETVATLRDEASSGARLVAAGCAASLIAIAVHSVVDFQFYIPANVMVAAWIAGVADGITARRRPAAH